MYHHELPNLRIYHRNMQESFQHIVRRNWLLVHSPSGPSNLSQIKVADGLSRSLEHTPWRSPSPASLRPLSHIPSIMRKLIAHVRLWSTCLYSISTKWSYSSRTLKRRHFIKQVAGELIKSEIPRTTISMEEQSRRCRLQALATG